MISIMHEKLPSEKKPKEEAIAAEADRRPLLPKVEDRGQKEDSRGCSRGDITVKLFLQKFTCNGGQLDHYNDSKPPKLGMARPQ